MKTNTTKWRETVFEDRRIQGIDNMVVRSISDIVTGPKCLVDAIYFNGLDVIRCYEGRFRFTFKDRPEFVLEAGDTVVLYPRHIVTIEALAKRNRVVYGVFEGEGVEEYFDELGFYDCARGKTESHYDSIMELRRQLEQDSQSNLGFRRMCNTMLSDILETQLREMRVSGNALIFDAITQIHRNLRKGEASLKAVCDALDVSRVHLHRLFVAEGIGSPSDFIRGKQMHIVRDLLENTKLSLAAIAKRTGFLSQAHFTTFVKRMTKLTPSAVRAGAIR